MYWLFAAALIVSQLLFRKNLIRSMMQAQISLPDQIWARLNYSWVAFFVVMGVLNLYVAFWGSYSTAAWVNFKLFGGMGLMLLFVVAQSFYLSKFMQDTA